MRAFALAKQAYLGNNNNCLDRIGVIECANLIS